MKLFGGHRQQRPSPQSEREMLREALQHAREQQYLEQLSQMTTDDAPREETDKVAPAPRSPEPRPAPPPHVASEETLTPVESTTEDPFVTLVGVKESALGDFSFGDIVLLGNDTLCLYDRFIPEKEYDVVHVLQTTGTLDPQGISLAGHGAVTIGRLPATAMRRCCEAGVWERDLIVFHLYEFDNTHRVPYPTGIPAPTPSPEAAPPTAEAEAPPMLTRGRRFTINFGDQRWEAVHWGHDEQGSLVAHNTTGEWTLLHLDLDRFQDSLEILERVSDRDLAEIEKALIALTQSDQAD